MLEEIPRPAVAIALLEHRWAIPLRGAIMAAGGFPVLDTWVPRATSSRSACWRLPRQKRRSARPAACAAARASPTGPPGANMAQNPVFLYVAAYGSEDDARGDYEALKDLHAVGLVGTYDAAIVTKADGKVHVRKHEKPTQHGAWTGLAVGAVVGILFPPSIIGAGVIGAGAGGLVGHLWRGMSRSDVKELGEMLDDGEAAIVIIGASRVEEQLGKALSHAERALSRELDAEAEELERHVAEAQQSTPSA